jgi:hypothetical protein
MEDGESSRGELLEEPFHEPFGEPGIDLTRDESFDLLPTERETFRGLVQEDGLSLPRADRGLTALAREKEPVLLVQLPVRPLEVHLERARLEQRDRVALLRGSKWHCHEDEGEGEKKGCRPAQ